MLENLYRKKADDQLLLLGKTINALVKDKNTRQALNHHMNIIVANVISANKEKIRRRNKC